MQQKETLLLHLLARFLPLRMVLFLPTSLLPRNQRALAHPLVQTHSNRISLPTLTVGTAAISTAPVSIPIMIYV